jgi:hypothetical protein
MTFVIDDLSEPLTHQASRERSFMVRDLGRVYVPLAWANSTDSSIEATTIEQLNLLELGPAFIESLRVGLHLTSPL